MNATANAGHRNGHALFPSPEPRPPVRAAPASMGSAGISAGAQVEFKTNVCAPRLRAAALPKDDDQADKLASGLGYLSLALGAAELVAPRTIAGSLGMPGAAPIIRGYGAREVGAGIGILSSASPQAKARWVWGRVLGDVIDLATLGAGLSYDNPKRGNVVGAMAVVGVVTVLDVLCALSLGKAASPDAARPRAGDDRRAQRAASVTPSPSTASAPPPPRPLPREIPAAVGASSAPLRRPPRDRVGDGCVVGGE